jgi:hypothetical protein
MEARQARLLGGYGELLSHFLLVGRIELASFALNAAQERFGPE